jgi:hypothetical protein
MNDKEQLKQYIAGFFANGICITGNNGIDQFVDLFAPSFPASVFGPMDSRYPPGVF